MYGNKRNKYIVHIRKIQNLLMLNYAVKLFYITLGKVNKRGQEQLTVTRGTVHLCLHKAIHELRCSIML